MAFLSFNIVIAADDLGDLRVYCSYSLVERQKARPRVKRIADDIGNPNSITAVANMLDRGTLDDRIYAVGVAIKFLTNDSIDSDLKEEYKTIVTNKGWPEEIFQVWNSIHQSFPHLDANATRDTRQANRLCVRKDLAFRRMLQAQKFLEPKIKCSFEEYVRGREQVQATIAEPPQSERTFFQYFMSCFQGKKYKRSQVLAGNGDF